MLDGVMVFGDRWQIFRISLRHGCRAIPIAWTIVEGKGLVQVNKLKSMLEKVQRFMKRYVKQVTLLADAGFRDCDWAQLCLDLGWNYAIRIACNTYITLPDGTSDRWTTGCLSTATVISKCSPDSRNQTANQCLGDLDHG